jgi:hypothetical protein
MPAFRFALIAPLLLTALAACANTPEDEAPQPVEPRESCRNIEPIGARLSCEEDLKRRGPQVRGL